MEPLFTIQYGEYAVADYLSKNLNNTSVFIPSSAQEKGIDLLLYRHDCSGRNMTNSIQVKMSRTYFDKKVKLPDCPFHLWYNRFEVRENANWFILIGIYPVFPKRLSSGADTSRPEIRWGNIMLAFTNPEMKLFISEVKQKKNTTKDDRMFGFSFNDNGSVYQTRGFSSYRDMSQYLIERRINEIDQSFE